VRSEQAPYAGRHLSEVIAGTLQGTARMRTLTIKLFAFLSPQPARAHVLLVKVAAAAAQMARVREWKQHVLLLVEPKLHAHMCCDSGANAAYAQAGATLCHGNQLFFMNGKTEATLSMLVASACAMTVAMPLHTLAVTGASSCSSLVKQRARRTCNTVAATQAWRAGVAVTHG
jgi:hypothetical protein